MIRTKTPLRLPPLALEAPNYYQYLHQYPFQFQFQPLTTLVSRPPSPESSVIPVPVPFCRVCLCNTRPRPHRPYRTYCQPPSRFPPSEVSYDRVRVKVTAEGKGEETSLTLSFFKSLLSFLSFLFSRFDFERSGISPSINPAVKSAVLFNFPFKRLLTQKVALRTCHQPP